MPSITAGKLCEVLGGSWIRGDKKVLITGIISRCSLARKGHVYFDVKGGQGGNENILDAIKNGATAIVISKYKKKLPCDYQKIAVIAVPKVWEAFWTAIKFYRDMYNIPVVGVTGTSGKTTTKEMISSIFRRRWKVLKTVGNLNLPHFVPSHIMRLKFGYDAAVFEIGMNRPGQISKQSRIIQPKVGVITHIGAGHIEHLGSFENVISEKAGIIEGIPNNGFLILNRDDPATGKINLSKFKGRIVYYGLVNSAHYTADKIMYGDKGTSFRVKVDGKFYNIFIPTFGRHNVYNALAAIAAARCFNFDMNSIKNGLASYRRPHMRLQIVKGINNTLLINDTYNANPSSIIAGLEVLSILSKGKTSIAVLGNMLEQGKYSVQNHRKVGRKADELKIDQLVTVGIEAKEFANGVKSKGMKINSFNSTRQAVKFLRENLPKNSVVLVKGSRGARMEWVVKGLKKEH